MKRVLVIGAGPAGLTAAYELLKHPGFEVVILEESPCIGGIARTAVYKGNRFDIGGHRFFSKSDRVKHLWQEILPLQGGPARDDLVLGWKVPLSNTPGSPDPEKVDSAMLLRQRVSRIFYLRKFFDYPLRLNLNTIHGLGFVRMIRIGVSYVFAYLKPTRPEKSLEDFLVNRFGRKLYQTFFEDYTYKIWGRHPSAIPPDWGAQRIRGISVLSVLGHALKGLFSRGTFALRRDPSSVHENDEVSFIDRFFYPKLGSGQLWENMAERVKKQGGEICFYKKVVGIETEGARVSTVVVDDVLTGHKERWVADYVLSSMPIKDLVRGFVPSAPADVQHAAGNLAYRDYIIIGLLCRKFRLRNNEKEKALNERIPDQWIYIQEHDAKIGRLQIVNNWSPYMVKDSEIVLLGAEYFCQEGDAFWQSGDQSLIDFAGQELAKLQIIAPGDVLDGVVIREKKAYPAYFEGYREFFKIRSFLDKYENLFLMGRNGMHRYNNMDHSMLAAMACVDNVVNGQTSKENVWSVNAEEEYGEANGA